jgi:hypothetical protein
LAFGLDIALPTQAFGHAFAVIDIHLAAEGFDEELLWTSHSHDPKLFGQLGVI